MLRGPHPLRERRQANKASSKRDPISAELFKIHEIPQRSEPGNRMSIDLNKALGNFYL